MELAIDTSTRYASVGISREGNTTAELTWRSAQNHSVELVPAIQSLTARSGVEMSDLTAVFLASGPGAFSALRVGMSTAKALAMAGDIPLVAVNTLDVEAAPYLGLGYAVRAVIDAGHRKVYVGSYHLSATMKGDFTGAYESVDIDTLSGLAAEHTLFCGEGVALVADAVRSVLGKRALVAGTAPPTRKASVLARLAYGRWQRNGPDELESLQPLYIRGSQFDVTPRG